MASAPEPGVGSPGQAPHPLSFAVKAVIDGGRTSLRQRERWELGGSMAPTEGKTAISLHERLDILCELLRYDHCTTGQLLPRGGFQGGQRSQRPSTEPWRREVGDAIVSWLVARLLDATAPSAFYRHRPSVAGRDPTCPASINLLGEVAQGVARLVSGGGMGLDEQQESILTDQVMIER